MASQDRELRELGITIKELTPQRLEGLSLPQLQRLENVGLVEIQSGRIPSAQEERLKMSIGVQDGLGLQSRASSGNGLLLDNQPRNNVDRGNLTGRFLRGFEEETQQERFSPGLGFTRASPGVTPVSTSTFSLCFPFFFKNGILTAINKFI